MLFRSGYAVCAGDCDDANSSANPGLLESCDGVDNDCDGVVPPLEADLDGDGQAQCDGDCNDLDPSTHPGAYEICGDGIDNDCDGSVDNDSVDEVFWYADTDGDGHGDETDSIQACDAPTGYVAAPVNSAYECDDTDAAVFPAAVELCNAADDDCDGLTDEQGAMGCSQYYRDIDGDLWGAENATPRCLCGPDIPNGYTAFKAGECDDYVASTYPGAEEAGPEATRVPTPPPPAVPPTSASGRRFLEPASKGSASPSRAEDSPSCRWCRCARASPRECSVGPSRRELGVPLGIPSTPSWRYGRPEVFPAAAAAQATECPPEE